MSPITDVIAAMQIVQKERFGSQAPIIRYGDVNEPVSFLFFVSNRTLARRVVRVLNENQVYRCERYESMVGCQRFQLTDGDLLTRRRRGAAEMREAAMNNSCRHIVKACRNTPLRPFLAKNFSTFHLPTIAFRFMCRDLALHCCCAKACSI
ncbi:hypothetical protein NXC24_PB00411 (plasmid) [Rhizobium sp. NXC24]|nr:hypothetical protein NXC24_PB00411 [Rhizobium sp. NXC24]